MNIMIILKWWNIFLIMVLVLAIFKLISIRKKRNHYKRRKRIICLRKIIALTGVLLMIVNMFLIGVIKFRNPLNPTKEDMIEEITVVQYVLDDVLSGLEFHSEVINNSTYAVWENITNNYLHYEYYEEWSIEDSIEKSVLRDKYLTRIREESNLPIVSLADIQRLAKDFYGTNLLPETDMTLEEVNKQTPSLDVRMKAAPDLYKAEFWLRVSILNEESSFECMYQAGRAGDDVFKTLINQNAASTKEMLFYSAVTLSLYQQALKRDSGINNLKTSLIKYRIGEIYYYLYKYLEYDTESAINQDQFSTHLLLSAEAYFLSSYDDFQQEMDGGDINKEQPFHDAYLAMIEYDLIKIYGFTDRDIVEMCYLHAKRYLNSPSAKSNNIKSCEDIILKLDALGFSID